MSLGCIYYIFCKESGKGYVGQTKYPNPSERWRNHWSHYKTAKGNIILYNAFKKYGKDAFTLETLCVVPHVSLMNMEGYFAEQLETYVWDNPGGYNMVLCDRQSHLGIKRSAETCAKLSNRFYSVEVRKKMSDAHLGHKPKPENLKKRSESLKGRIFSDESKAKMKQAWILRKQKMIETKSRKDAETAKCKEVSESKKEVEG